MIKSSQSRIKSIGDLRPKIRLRKISNHQFIKRIVLKNMKDPNLEPDL